MSSSSNNGTEGLSLLFGAPDNKIKVHPFFEEDIYMGTRYNGKSVFDTFSKSIIEEGVESPLDGDYIELPAKIFANVKRDEIRIITKNKFEIVISCCTNYQWRININEFTKEDKK